MAITFYCGSGSPFAWRVWLTLEHRRVPYDLKVLSFQAGDLQKPEYLAINPRGKTKEKQPANAVTIPPHLSKWMERIEALPYFGRTYPPHWKTA